MKRADALLLGPGLAADPDTIGLVCEVVAAAPVPVVLDADALRPEVVEAVRGKPFIGTPHAGEYQRIAPALTAADRAVLVQKGPLTRITHGEAVWFSPFGGPVLARGGSGDILAGITGGLLAQHPADLPAAAARAVVWHGLAADLLARTHGQVAVETSQLLEQLGPALTRNPCQTP
jgi:NAD(P)H-hydrate epimerase